MRRCVFKEGVRCAKGDFGGPNCRCEGVSWEEAVEAVSLLSDAVYAYGKAWKKWAREELGISLRLDTPPPAVRGGVMRAGFWVGVAYVRMGRGEVLVEVAPRVECYADMLRRAGLVFKPVRRLFLLAYATAVGTFNLSSAQRVAALAHELYWALLRGPRRELVALPDGQVLTRLNVSLLSAVAASLRYAVEALRAARSLEGASRAVRDIIDFYVEPAEAALRGLWSPELADAMALHEVEDFGEYWHLPAAARRLAKTGRVVAEAGPSAAFALVPSTKVYELYLMALVVEALREIQGGRVEVVDVGGQAVRVGRYVVYFNYAPASAIVKSMTGRKPRPDVVVEGGGARVVLDAKYKRADRLELKDALRFVAYLADVATDHRLHGVVAALSGREPVGASIRASGNAVEMRVEFVKADPCDHEGSLEEIRGVLEGLIRSAG
ncbi:MAG: hypothetical protein QXP98_07150 [Thermoproteus sp.]